MNVVINALVLNANRACIETVFYNAGKAICSDLSKVLKRMINFYFDRYLETNNSLNVRQYGFHRGCSIGDILVLLSKDGIIPFIALETIRV